MEARNRPLIKGEMAPDFTLKDHEGKDFKLSAMQGKRVLLSFHPLAWTDICARQMESLEENADTFTALNTVAAGINVDPLPSKKAWAESLGIKKIRLLSDFWPHGEVAALYGLFREKDGFSERSNIILDEEGKVIFSKVYPISELPDIREVIKVLEDS